jgi:hypothetical protein
MVESGGLRVEWRLEPGETEDARVVLADLRSRGGEVEFQEERGRQLAFLPIIGGAIGVVALAEAIVKFRRRRAAERRSDAERSAGGWIIDARGAAVTIVRSSKVPYPTVIVVNERGDEVKVDTSLDEDQETSTIADLLKAAMAAVEG